MENNMKLINKEQISHITVFKETEGIWSYSRGHWQKMLYVPYRKHKWWEFDKETEEGFYENGNSYWSNKFLSKEQVENSKKWFIRNNSVWTFPFIQVFSGGIKIHTAYFRTYEELEQHVKENYNHCTIKYQD